MNSLEQVKGLIKEEIQAAVLKAELATEEQIPNVVLESPKDKTNGDFSTNMAMQLARVAKKAPRMIAEELVANFDKAKASIEKIEIAGPGFINFYMDNSYLTDLIPTIVNAGEAYGETNTGKGEKVQVEFVSANPTGDLHLGHARGAAVGDTLCNLLAKAGYDVSREYYINDAGNQIHNLALSVEARYMQALGLEKEMPEDGYHGADIIGIGKSLAEEFGDRYAKADEKESYEFYREYGLKYELAKLQKDLESFRVKFDVWFSETSLYKNGKIDQALAVLKERDEIFEEDGATWFRSMTYGDDKNRVLIKNDGSYTYLTPDIAYHRDKLERGFDKLINIWGADHHGYIPRMKAAIQALGYDKETLEVEIIQMVQLYQNGEKMKMSKRTGKAVTLRELMEEVGVDAMRYFFAMRSGDSHLDFDMDLAVSKSNENPVYYAQYAHARVCSILRQGEELGLATGGDVNYKLVTSEKEVELLKKLGEFPAVVADAAQKRLPHRITNYAFELAATLHSFYNAEKVLNQDNLELSKARYELMKAVRTTLQNALAIVGVSAPEKM
ncbi:MULTISPECIES: arginine--tRNA ligase [Bacillus cereus group]|uniref:Arginine--tRNA ligase 2 n=1 Tax=Bacillus thuringiensis subsp. konkukian (strain 97-27) TaxID=281309 RepID=SYR2_BACHK|nr:MULTISPECIES: arginine--tRNA ligase [Bacillus cereus group]Q6HAS1.1 RecName: Full=Arginine--tRNA ligase 2; AltName: Full=Arginyl-tRNA synthetase 2; Short=ArgRS 2 [[Bacillus thuringiensis] serovar konkukian str. 97-27]AAT63452.1 arginine--tRNA ligase (arginyl-tRNA synthetase) [[Bacillus thuringiensis] serovar konkukian str. 97-27]AJI35348.1 arginine--tRNA ligase [Bacillus thuringiensis]MCU5381228.1 arginine--tRNA ligase [Bacillus cereus]QKI27608.1 arginine--tRNA ligase [Bacillus thuringiensi